MSLKKLTANQIAERAAEAAALANEQTNLECELASMGKALRDEIKKKRLRIMHLLAVVRTGMEEESDQMALEEVGE